MFCAKVLIPSKEVKITDQKGDTFTFQSTKLNSTKKRKKKKTGRHPPATNRDVYVINMLRVFFVLDSRSDNTEKTYRFGSFSGPKSLFDLVIGSRGSLLNDTPPS